MPKLSVLMPTYNGEKYISQAIDSILSQSFRDYELIVIDDGSKDRSAEIVASFNDKRIRYIANSTNLGLAGARNRAIEVAAGEYLAWLDCDDISLPGRLEKQVTVLDKNPEIGLCGSWVRTLGLNPEQLWRYPTDGRFVRSRMLFDNPLATSATMLRRSCLTAGELRFDTRFPPAEDYDLWERISRTSGAYNIPEVLVLYRIHPNQISTLKREQQRKSVSEIQLRLLAQLQVIPTIEEISLHFDIGVDWNFPTAVDAVDRAEAWLLKLASANDEFEAFPSSEFKQVLAERWFYITRIAAQKNAISWRRYGMSKLSTWEPLRLRRQAQIFFNRIRYGI